MSLGMNFLKDNLRVYLFVLVFLPFIGQSQDAKVYYQQAVNKMVIGKSIEAIALFSKVISLNDSLSDAFYNRGVCYQKTKEIKKAISDFSKVIKLRPKMYQAYNNRGLLYSETKRYRLADRDFNKSLELNSSYVFTYMYLANNYFAMKKYPEAISNADIVLSYLPNYVRAHEIIAQAGYITKKYELSLKHYNKLCEKITDKEEYYLARGYVFVALGDNNAACVDFGLATELGNLEAREQMKVVCGK